ncbi:LpqB family beta-propeller domain-containing protein [Bifidobacterium olomucense]|uniref:Sporulation and spore germination n=1 Tax=Bifidobacterium olomucense TaxID=2675324 RepID=A0A7Y0EZM4_9BIFI|nr:LpqB family beta-propeller domain-containing protein [Bifidobacterium sp. DSM 109959]NMM98351.1 sporulation and spore germination [Bifidobacterium sp. DSM 109959]
MRGNQRNTRIWRLAVTVLTVMSCCIGLASCASPLGLPVSGLVQTLSPDEQEAQRVYTNPEGPAQDAQPEEIVQGFYDAMPAGVQSDGYRVAQQFLTSSAAGDWNGDASAVIYTGTPDFRRRANTMSAPQGAESSLIVEVSLQVVGTLDAHGVYTPDDSAKTSKIAYTLIKTKGQWRISSLENGVVISSADFEQIFRQVSVYQVSSSGNQLVPDVRWLSWRNWRVRAVSEVLSRASDWLSGAVVQQDMHGVAITADSVPIHNGTAVVTLNQAMGSLPNEVRAMLVHRIRLTLGDGNAQYSLKITGDGVDYSDADEDVQLDVNVPKVNVYTLTGGHVVSLASSSPLRVGEASGFDDAEGLAFSTSVGGAVLRGDDVVECLTKDGASCGEMFDGAPMRSITAGFEGEVWAVSADGRNLYVRQGSKESELSMPWLASDSSVTAVTVSPEGSRLAVAISGETMNGVVVTGVVRNDDDMVTTLARTAATVSVAKNVSLLTFYDDLSLVYISVPQNANGQQEGYRQTAPGPAKTQRLPNDRVVALAAGQISQYRRLAVLDDLGIVRSVSGSLDGSWSIADSQVTALGAQ